MPCLVLCVVDVISFLDVKVCAVDSLIQLNSNMAVGAGTVTIGPMVAASFARFFAPPFLNDALNGTAA